MLTTELSAPPRSLEQRRAALDRANAVRSARARFKEQMKRTARSEATQIAERHIAAPHPNFETMRVRDMLMAVPKLGPVKADIILRHSQAAPSKTLAGLSDRQRVAISQELRSRHGG